MLKIPFAAGVSNRTAYGLPEARLVNLFAETNQGDAVQSVRLPRPGLVEYDDNGSGPVRGFAVVHCLGILTSMFSAVTVTQLIMALVYGRQRKVQSISV